VRARYWVPVALALGVSPFACVDLFHSTADLHLVTTADASTPDANTPDFCMEMSDGGREHAEYACAWLGACERPTGRNAFGLCMFQALLAYDCAANPAHRVRGAPQQIWACLAAAKSCNDVDNCVLPPAARATPNIVGCSDAGPWGTSVLIECSDGGVQGENCSLWGQSCVIEDGVAGCGPAAGVSPCASGAAPIGCNPNNGQLLCDDAGTVAIDCTGNGAQGCARSQIDAASWVACLADDAGPGGACVPSTTAFCDGGFAQSCPSGVTEVIDCDGLLAADAGCQSGSLDPQFDWTSPCTQVPPRCTSDLCGGDGGPSTTLIACVRGAPNSVECVSQGLGECRMVSIDDAGHAEPACAPP